MKNVPARQQSLVKEGESKKTLWKVAYFRVKGWEKTNDPDSREVADPSKAPILEICLLPADEMVETAVSDGKTELLKVPKSQKIIQLRSGDVWPGEVPNTVADVVRNQAKHQTPEWYKLHDFDLEDASEEDLEDIIDV